MDPGRGRHLAHAKTLSDGVALGTREFVNEVFARHREKFGPRRKDGARPIRALSAFGLTALRNLRVRALG